MTHTSTRDSGTLTGKAGSVSCGITTPFSWVLVCTRLFLPSKSLCFLSSVEALYSNPTGFQSQIPCDIYIYIYISLIALLLKNLPTIQETLVKFLGQKGRKVPWRRDRLPTPIFMGFPGGSDGKEFNCNARDLDLIPWLGRSPRGGHGKSLQCSCLKSPLNKGGLVAYSPWGHKESAHRKHTRIHTYIYI